MATAARWVDAVRDAEAWVEAARLVHEGYCRTVGAILILEGHAAADVASLLDMDEGILDSPHVPLEIDDVLWSRVSLLHEFVNPEPRAA